jgi:hypothetical protein
MSESAVNETEAARVALEEIWRQLAPIVVEGKELQSRATTNPAVLDEPWGAALNRWLIVFDREIAAVQAIYEATQQGAKVSGDDVRAARSVGEKLLSTITETRERIPTPA